MRYIESNDNSPYETVIPRGRSYHKMRRVHERNPAEGKLSAEEPACLMKRATRSIPLMNMRPTE